jgi:hypothetical protein
MYLSKVGSFSTGAAWLVYLGLGEHRNVLNFDGTVEYSVLDYLIK